MRLHRLGSCIVIGLAIAGLGLTAPAPEETIVISKKRLAELEQKAAESERLKKALAEAQRELQRLKIQAAPAATPVVEPPRVTPPIVSLPPLGKDDIVLADDLMNHYQTDPAAADERYRRGRLTIQGKVADLEKQLLVNSFQVSLKTARPDWKIVCHVQPPAEFTAVYMTAKGTSIEGNIRGQLRQMLVRVGDTMLLTGRCRGLRDGSVVIDRVELVQRNGQAVP